MVARAAADPAGRVAPVFGMRSRYGAGRAAHAAAEVSPAGEAVAAPCGVANEIGEAPPVQRTRKAIRCRSKEFAFSGRPDESGSNEGSAGRQQLTFETEGHRVRMKDNAVGGMAVRAW